MDQERQFKGVWIPAELWLNEKLSMLEKVIYVEIDSLDNENHCTASNEYFAGFCHCSVSAASRAIKHLKELGMIEEVAFNGRVRKLCLGKNPKLPRKKSQAAEEKIRSINIYNKTDNRNVSIINNTNKKSLVKKKSLYTKLEDEIFLFTKNIKIQNALKQFLNLQLEIYKEQGKTYYLNIFKSRLNKLKTDFDEKDWLTVIKNATDHGWQNFYPIKEYEKPTKKKEYNQGLCNDTYTEEEKEEIRKWQEEQIAKGERIIF